MIHLHKLSKRILLLALLTLVFVARSNAQTPTVVQTSPAVQAQQTEVFDCLTSSVCGEYRLSVNPGEPTPTPQSTKCMYTKHDVAAHEVLLTSGSAVSPATNKDGTPKQAYVLEVLMLPDPYGTISTTGSAAGDRAIKLCSTTTCDPGTANYERLQAIPQLKYQFVNMYGEDQKTVINNPITVPTSGVLPNMYWESSRGGFDVQGNISSTASYFYLYYKKDEESSLSTSGTHIQGSFRVTAAQNNCVIVRYDPWGKVFDKDSLEPIPNVQVSVMKKNGTNYRLVTNTDIAPATIVNPMTTDVMGGYSILLPTDTYKMTVSRGTIDNKTVNQNYTLAYTDLYDGADFVENKELHFDIPVANNPPYKAADVTVVSKTEFIDTSVLPNQTVVKMQFSHPLTRLNVYAEMPGATGTTPTRRLVMSVQADKNGWVEAKVPMECKAGETACLNSGEVVRVEKERVDLTKNGQTQSFRERVVNFVKSFLSVPTVEAQTVAQKQDIVLDPVLNYVEGCAYSGVQKLPNAKVEVFPTFSQNAFYTTTADENGCFSISSEHLPKFPYVLRYTSAFGVVVKQTTSEFINKNATYIAARKINLNQYKDAQGGTVAPGAKPAGSGNGTSQTGNGTQPDAANNPANAQQGVGQQSASSNLVVIVVILLLLVGTAGLLLAFYIYKKNQKAVMPKD